MHDDKMPRLSQRHKPDNRRGRQDSLGLFQPSSEPGDHLLEGSWPWVGSRGEIVTSEPGQCFFCAAKSKAQIWYPFTHGEYFQPQRALMAAKVWPISSINNIFT